MRPVLPPPELAGLTHIGKVRQENQDHFLACALDPSVRSRETSLPEVPGEWGPLSDDAAARTGGITLAAVADGVGGGPAGERASRQALLSLPKELSEVILDDSQPLATRGRLASAVLRLHGRLLELAESDQGLSGMATTLTAWLGLGDEAYVVQVGDSRCYRLRAGVLELLTRDQTMAQDLVDQGLIDDLSEAPLGWDNILTGALGGSSADPAITATDRQPGDVLLVCSDGVMKHITDHEIGEILGTDEDSGTTVRKIVQRALDGGGTDNITAVVVREAQ
jgi:serine/threonine protein phosphatase PrpC